MGFGATEEEICEFLNGYDLERVDIVLHGKFIMDEADGMRYLKFKILNMNILDAGYSSKQFRHFDSMNPYTRNPYNVIYVEGELFYVRSRSNFVLKVFNYYITIGIDDYFINTFEKVFEDNKNLDIIIKGIFILQEWGTSDRPYMGLYRIKEYNIE
jgi:hypothetical protein